MMVEMAEIVEMDNIHFFQVLCFSVLIIFLDGLISRLNSFLKISSHETGNINDFIF